MSVTNIVLDANASTEELPTYEAPARVRITDDARVIVEQIRPAPETQVLIFSPNGEWAVKSPSDPASQPHPLKIKDEFRTFGVVGLLELNLGKYLIVVTEKDFVCQSLGRVGLVWRVRSVRMVPVTRKEFLTLDEEEHERTCLASVSSVMSSGLMYYSLDIDLSNNTQRVIEFGGNPRTPIRPNFLPTLFQNLHDPYFFNKHLLRMFLHDASYPYILPLICGYVGSTYIKSGHMPIHVMLIGRICRYNAGTRARRRGVDGRGAPAIEVESELLVHTPHTLASFTQLRGSVPLYWKQECGDTPHINPKLDFEGSISADSFESARVHFENVYKRYGSNITVLDLLSDKEPDQAILSESYSDLLRQLNRPEIEYIRRPSPTSSLHGLEALTTETRLSQAEQGFFSMMLNAVDPTQYESKPRQFVKFMQVQTSPSSITSYYAVFTFQRGIFRISDLDCVDDVNVAEYLMANEALVDILHHAKMWPRGARKLSDESMAKLGRLWAGHGDAIAQQYTGTAARGMGRLRNLRGFSRLYDSYIKDSLIRLARTYLDSLQENTRQDNIDLFMGTHPSAHMVLEHSDQHIVMKRRLSLKDYNETSFPVATLIMAKKFTAPKVVDSPLAWISAMVWLLIYFIYTRFLQVSPTQLRRPTQSTMDFKLLMSQTVAEPTPTTSSNGGLHVPDTPISLSKMLSRRPSAIDGRDRDRTMEGLSPASSGNLSHLDHSRHASLVTSPFASRSGDLTPIGGARRSVSGNIK
ncbi:hypothetical protein SmJEL517_g03887 [Synchytrium microbalum]|uniref:SAC domain-containing protein n=1 Tax=Synchytrium microbalum TaxID=1806994 RepID=A0A507C5K0_9FUNG|nr:uncharacterized protein SmJEL517_g03887 [Synchytrium microbalum]TPX33256.1 hypothetical protein SmJEL517_g03887 [Synchytrium microbalum]